MEDDSSTRIANEYALLEAMCPGEVAYDPKSRELDYSHSGAALVVRLPDLYPAKEAPQVISAVSASKVDFRDKLQSMVQSLHKGEEALDVVIDAFQGLLAEAEAEAEDLAEDGEQPQGKTTALLDSTERQTTVIWLHHLLKMSKRKLALSPADESVSGISKPGYPGVLVFSGPASGVQEHVNTLKQQNWAAFQVRYEDMSEWEFGHGAGVKEIGSMAEVVNDVGGRRDEFLEAMRMR